MYIFFLYLWLLYELIWNCKENDYILYLMMIRYYTILSLQVFKYNIYMEHKCNHIFLKINTSKGYMNQERTNITKICELTATLIFYVALMSLINVIISIKVNKCHNDLLPSSKIQVDVYLFNHQENVQLSNGENKPCTMHINLFIFFSIIQIDSLTYPKNISVKVKTKI